MNLKPAYTRPASKPAQALRCELTEVCRDMDRWGEEVHAIRVNLADFGYGQMQSLYDAIRRTNAAKPNREAIEVLSRFSFKPLARENGFCIIVIERI